MSEQHEPHVRENGAPHSSRGPWRTLVKVYYQARVRPRLATSTTLGLLSAFLLPGTVSGPTRALVSWDVAVGLYLSLALYMMCVGTGSIETMRRRSRQQDDGAAAVLGLTIAAALASLAAIVLELAGVKDLSPSVQNLHLILAGVTIFLSWAFVHTAFALHYAHEFYLERKGERAACLEFPGGGQPDYLDFLYFSFVIGTTSQTADVSIASRSLRRLALLHGIITSFFNTTLVALTVNIAAGLI
jgi:uncharacterized membrane protein